VSEERTGEHAGRLPVDERIVLRIPSSTLAPAGARRAVREFILDRPVAAGHLNSLLLLVSEVVTNAVTHPSAGADAEIELSLAVTDSLTRIVVSDQGIGFTVPTDPLQRERVGGYGLMLLDIEASRWGTLEAPGRFSVWFEVDHVPATEHPPEFDDAIGEEL
jgi:anti-sigma regulatory factor (Ser/Thr protein kinase)